MLFNFLIMFFLNILINKVLILKKFNKLGSMKNLLNYHGDILIVYWSFSGDRSIIRRGM